MPFLWAALAASLLLVPGSARAGEWPVSETRLKRLESGPETDRIQAADRIPNARAKIRSRLLAPLLRDPSTEVRLHAIDAVLSVPPSERTSLVAPLIIDGERSVVEHALAFLKLAGSGEAVPWLEQVLVSAEPRIKASALETLIALDGVSSPELETIFLSSLRDSESIVRRAAIRGLALHGEEKSLPSLALLLRDPDVRVREDASRTIAAIGGEVAFGFLRMIARGSSESEVRALLPAYLTMAESWTEPDLSRFLVDNLLKQPIPVDNEMRRAVAMASKSVWIRRALELAQSPAQRSAVARLFGDLDWRGEGEFDALIRARVIRCLEQETGSLCHQMASGLIADADERRVNAYRAGRLRAAEFFIGIELVQHPKLTSLAFEMLEDADSNVRGVALNAISASSLAGDEGIVPLARLLEWRESSREERAVVLSLLSRSSSATARSLIALYEKSSVLSVRHLAEEARLVQLFQDPRLDCLELITRARAVLLRPDSHWGRGRHAQLSLSAYGCLLHSLPDLVATERIRIERLLLNSALNASQRSESVSRDDLSLAAFSLAQSAAADERALLVQISLRLGLPKQVQSRLVRGELDAETKRQVAVGALARSADEGWDAGGSGSDRLLRALTLARTARTAPEILEKLRAAEDPASLSAFGARLGLIRSASAGSIPESQRTLVIERACGGGRSLSESERIESILLVGALGPSDVPEPCWRTTMLGASAASEPRIRLAGLVAAAWSRGEASSSRILRVCRLYETNPTLRRVCAPSPDPASASEMKEESALISRRLPGQAAGALAFLAFFVSAGEVGLEIGVTDRAGRFLGRAEREYLEFVLFE